MKKLLFVAAFSFSALLGGYAMATLSTSHGIQEEVVEHGGGCRKSSPPGRCCHKNHKTGEVHCH